MPSFPFTEQYLTAGALRTLQLAQHLQMALGGEQVTPEHLLAALILDESRATGMLNQFDVDIHTLPEAYQPYATEEAAADLSAKVSSESLDRRAHETLSGMNPSDEFYAALLVAQQRAASLGRHAEIGTEHLLWGLLHSWRLLQ